MSEKYTDSSRNCGRSHHQRQHETFDSHAFKSNRRNECVRMPRKTARSGSQTPLGRSGMSGAIHPLASGLPASSENAYHPRQFRVHLGNPGSVDQGGAVMSRRILVVEDQEDNRRILRDLLTSAGYEIIQAENGEEALAAAARERPDLILMDIQLPVLDGYEATRRIKADPALRAIPVIVVTSYALSGDENKARAAGCDAYVTKPFSPRALLAKIREYVP